MGHNFRYSDSTTERYNIWPLIDNTGLIGVFIWEAVQNCFPDPTERYPPELLPIRKAFIISVVQLKRLRRHYYRLRISSIVSWLFMKPLIEVVSPNGTWVGAEESCFISQGSDGAKCRSEALISCYTAFFLMALSDFQNLVFCVYFPHHLSP